MKIDILKAVIRTAGKGLSQETGRCLSEVPVAGSLSGVK